MKQRRVAVDDLDLRAVLRPASPTWTTGTWSDGTWWRASRTPEGPVTLRLEPVSGGVHCTAWGEGADWALEQAPELLGVHDTPETFRPTAGPLRELWKAHPGLRFGRTRRVLEILLPTILEQKVTTRGALGSWRAILRRFGEPSPGPRPLLLAPRPEVLAAVGYAELHPLNVERRRAETVRRACSYAGRLEQTVDMPAEQAAARLQALPGVGPWTAAHVAAVAFGDPDAVPLGDYHLPNAVSWVLAGEPRGDDARMLELLEPYRGDRGRVVRLIMVAGAWAPRRGPPLPMQDIRGR